MLTIKKDDIQVAFSYIYISVLHIAVHLSAGHQLGQTMMYTQRVELNMNL